MGNALMVPKERLSSMRRIKTHIIRDDLIIARKAKTLENKAIQKKIEEETKQAIARIDNVVKDQSTKQFIVAENISGGGGKDNKKDAVSIDIGHDINSDNGDVNDDDPPITNATKVPT